MAQTITQLTLAWLITTIEAARAGLTATLAKTAVADWGASPVREMCNHEKDLHIAAQVLGDMLNVRGAFADSGVPAAPHLEQGRPMWVGLDLSKDALDDLKKSLIDAGRRGARMCIEPMPTIALEAPAVPVQVQALDRARCALYAIGKTYDDSELRTRALEADEQIEHMLAAVPHAPAAPIHLGTPHCAGHSVPLGGSWSTIDADSKGV